MTEQDYLRLSKFLIALLKAESELSRRRFHNKEQNG
jgi:hypothetical protein